MMWLGMIIFIACSSYFALAVIQLLKTIAFIKQSRLALGIVVELEPLLSPTGYLSPVAHARGYYPVVEFITEKKKKFRIKGETATKPPTYKVGEKISVHYLAENPKDAKINTLLQLWGDPVLKIVGSTIFGLIGLAIIGSFR